MTTTTLTHPYTQPTSPTASAPTAPNMDTRKKKVFYDLATTPATDTRQKNNEFPFFSCSLLLSGHPTTSTTARFPTLPTATVTTPHPSTCLATPSGPEP
jgi:hypothetical protein